MTRRNARRRPIKPDAPEIRTRNPVSCPRTGALQCPLLLTPALGERPVPIGEIHGSGEDPMADLKRSARFTPFTSLWNVTGQPAISIPLGFGDDGLPTAAQLVAKPLGEDTLLQVAAQMEAAVGRPQQIPQLF